MKDLAGATRHVAKTHVQNGSVVLVLTMILADVRAWNNGGHFTIEVKITTRGVALAFAIAEHGVTLGPIHEHVLV
jgi:hypothetical protein